MIFQFFHSYMKKSSKSSLKKKKKGLLIYPSSIKSKLAIHFLKKLLHLADFRADAERVKSVLRYFVQGLQISQVCFNLHLFRFVCFCFFPCRLQVIMCVPSSFGVGFYEHSQVLSTYAFELWFWLLPCPLWLSLYLVYLLTLFRQVHCSFLLWCLSSDLAGFCLLFLWVPFLFPVLLHLLLQKSLVVSDLLPQSFTICLKALLNSLQILSVRMVVNAFVDVY